MRLYVVLTMALLLAPAVVTASTQEPRDGLGVTVVRVEGKGVYTTWTPAPGAVLYDVYRGASLDDMELIGQTPQLEYADFRPLDGDAWYMIISKVPTSVPAELGGPLRGKCLALRGATGLSLTLANCMPGDIPVVGDIP